MSGGDGVGSRVVALAEGSHGEVDLVGHRLAVQFVEVAGGGPGEELRAAHAELLCSLGHPLVGVVGDRDRCLHALSITRYDWRAAVHRAGVHRAARSEWPSVTSYHRSMRAVVINEGSVAWSERPEPVPGTAELLVRVRSAGLNRADLLQRAGRYPPPPGVPPEIPGLECAGVVEAVGPGTTRFAPGDAVMCLLGGAGQAELAVVHERVAMAVPASIPLEHSGGFPETFSTAYDALFVQCGLAAGDRLLVSGAAGGVGLAAVQLGATAGATVVASVRDPAKRDDVARFGALAIAPDDVVDHGPYDVVIELVGAPNLPTDLEALAVCGRIVVIGTGAGSRAELDLQMLMARRAVVRSSSLRVRPLEEKAALARDVERHVLPLLAAGRITVPIEASYGFADVHAAYEHFVAGGKLGKIVLVTEATARAS